VQVHLNTVPLGGDAHAHATLEPLLVPIDDIHPHPDNYNTGNTDTIAESIRTNGMYRPVYAQTTTAHIVAGNTTHAAAKQLGATRIPVMWLDIDNPTATRILLADNRIAALAQPDNTQLLELLDTLDRNYIGTGYDDTAIAALVRAVTADTYMGSDWKNDATAAFYDGIPLVPDDPTIDRAHHVLRVKTENAAATKRLFALLGADYDPRNPRKEMWFPIHTPHYQPPDYYE
jgi:ParB-like nuclease domain